MCGWTHNDIFLGDEFLVKQVSIKVLWWLALAIMVSATFRRLPLVSTKLVDCVEPSSTGLSLCGLNCIILLKSPDKFIRMTLSLMDPLPHCHYLAG